MSFSYEIITDPKTLPTSTGLLLPMKPQSSLKQATQSLSSDLQKEIASFAERFQFKGKEKEHLTFDSQTGKRIVVAVLPKDLSAFSILSWARKVFPPFKAAKARELTVDLLSVANETDLLVDALCSAAVAQTYETHKYKAPKKEKAKEKANDKGLKIFLRLGKAQAKRAMETARVAVAQTEATNLIRDLAQRAGNDLTTSAYVERAQAIAAGKKLKTKFFDFKELEKMGAGAFIAVAKGSDDRGSGILRVDYSPKGKSKGKIAFVGKGITFDTGGLNLKIGSGMYGMNEDMTGSAVALALVCLAKDLDWPYEISSYLAITDNVLSPRAFRPNDIVTTLKGITIEVIDTDAEGRMILSDTLTLASQSKPDLVLDFATLTGACVRAIGRNYSGAYTNRRNLYSKIIKAGRLSGERVWPFPNDKDYGEILKSDVADIKQCRLSGGPDHIEAGYFLGRFLAPNTPWVHVDLSAHEHDGGLAHIPAKTTGFGVRFASKLLDLLFQ